LSFITSGSQLPSEDLQGPPQNAVRLPWISDTTAMRITISLPDDVDQFPDSREMMIIVFGDEI
jgi:hypothetical protein